MTQLNLYLHFVIASLEAQTVTQKTSMNLHACSISLVVKNILLMQTLVPSTRGTLLGILSRWGDYLGVKVKL